MPKPTAKLKVDEEWEKEVWRLIEEQFGVPPLSGYRLLRSGKKRIRIISEEAFPLVDQVPCAGPAGLYFGEYAPHAIRLSMDGAQLIGPQATKHVVHLDADQAEAWLRGESIAFKDSRKGYVIVIHGHDILGCGSLSQDRLISFVPKARRPKASSP